MEAAHSSKELYFLNWNERMGVSGFVSKELYCLRTLGRVNHQVTPPNTKAARKLKNKVRMTGWGVLVEKGGKKGLSI
jgi:hypothetical protein